MQIGNKNFTLRNITLDTEATPNAVRSVYRAVNILLCLSNGINTLNDVTSHTKLSKPTVYRLLKTLEELFMVTQDPLTHQYHLGPLVNQIAANPVTNHQYLITCAFQELRQLWDYFGETVELNIMVGLQYIRLYEITSKFDLKVEAGPDPVGPVFVGATARVLLSQLDDADLKAALRYINIHPTTSHSIVERKDLITQSIEIREAGYAKSCGERIEGAQCISAPVRNYFWPVALSLVGPESRMKTLEQDAISRVKDSATRITSNIEEFFRAKGVIAE